LSSDDLARVRAEIQQITNEFRLTNVYKLKAAKELIFVDPVVLEKALTHQRAEGMRQMWEACRAVVDGVRSEPQIATAINELEALADALEAGERKT
jgi:hypothetical protein